MNGDAGVADGANKRKLGDSSNGDEDENKMKRVKSSEPVSDNSTALMVVDSSHTALTLSDGPAVRVARHLVLFFCHIIF